MITWDEAIASDYELAPGLDHIDWGSAPVVPDSQGHYPVAVPGRTMGVRTENGKALHSFAHPPARAHVS
jgi:hypothetical protein